MLLAMATGTGKTKTCVALIYRLLKTKRFRRILFLVDRSALGEQAANAFKETGSPFPPTCAGVRSSWSYSCTNCARKTGAFNGDWTTQLCSTCAHAFSPRAGRWCARGTLPGVPSLRG